MVISVIFSDENFVTNLLQSKLFISEPSGLCRFRVAPDGFGDAGHPPDIFRTVLGASGWLQTAGLQTSPDGSWWCWLTSRCFRMALGGLIRSGCL